MYWYPDVLCSDTSRATEWTYDIVHITLNFNTFDCGFLQVSSLGNTRGPQFLIVNQVNKVIISLRLKESLFGDPFFLFVFSLLFQGEPALDILWKNCMGGCL